MFWYAYPTSQKTSTSRQWAGVGATRQRNNRWRKMVIAAECWMRLWQSICSRCFYKWFWQSLTNLLENNLPISKMKRTLLTMFMNNFVTLHFEILWGQLQEVSFNAILKALREKPCTAAKRHYDTYLSRAISLNPIPLFISIKPLSLIQRHPNLKRLWSPNYRTDRKIRVSLNGWKGKL